MPDGSNNAIAEVSDEDESAEANESVQQEKKKKGSKLKLSAMFSAIVGMKSVHFKTTDDVPKGINFCKTERNQMNRYIRQLLSLPIEYSYSWDSYDSQKQCGD